MTVEIILPSRGEVLNPLEEHGRSLKDEMVAKFIADAIGDKIAV